MNGKIYVIGFNNQDRIDRLYASIPKSQKSMLLDNGKKTLSAPFGEYVKTGPDMFTMAFNYALCDSIQNKCVPIILNDDLVLEKGCTKALMDSIKAGAGIVAPMQVSKDKPDIVIFAGTGAAYPGGMHIRGRRSDENLFKKKDYKWLTFCAVALHPDMIKQIGILDPRMKMWFSDSDYCIRASQHDWKCEYNPDAVVIHENHAATDEQPQEWRKLQFVADRDIFSRKWGGEVLRKYSRA